MSRCFVLRMGVLVVAAFFAQGARASFHTFQIDEVYSSPDGSVQFIELHEAAGLPGQQFLAGHTLTSTQGGTTRVYTFPSDLPGGSTQHRYVLIATPGFAGLSGVTPDYTLPAPFLFPSGGTLDYAGVDQVAYPALPGDGQSSLDRAGVVAAATPTNFAGQTGTLARAPATVAAGVPALQPPAAAMLVALLASLAALFLSRVPAPPSSRGSAGRRRTPSSPTPSP